MNTENMNETTDPNRGFAAACHASALAGFVIPFGNILGPLILWLCKKDESELVRKEGREAVNFQLTTSLLMLLLIVLGMLACFTSPVFGGLTWIAIIVIGWIPVIIALVKAYNVYHGEKFDYPSVINFLK